MCEAGCGRAQQWCKSCRQCCQLSTGKASQGSKAGSDQVLQPVGSHLQLCGAPNSVIDLIGSWLDTLMGLVRMAVWWRRGLGAVCTGQTSAWLRLSGLQVGHCTVSLPELLSMLAGQMRGQQALDN